jgi:hypothetical protein
MGRKLRRPEACALLEAAIPMSLCVEFFARRRGTIRE